MARKKENRMFAPGKIEWMLDGGLETMGAGERQMLLVMAETQLLEGYKPTAEEKQVIGRLRALSGDDDGIIEGVNHGQAAFFLQAGSGHRRLLVSRSGDE